MLCLSDCLAEERGVPKEQVKTWIPYPGGAPANVAAALGRLGIKVSFVSAVGQDDLGEQMLDLLKCKSHAAHSASKRRCHDPVLAKIPAYAFLQLGMWTCRQSKGYQSPQGMSW